MLDRETGLDQQQSQAAFSRLARALYASAASYCGGAAACLSLPALLA